MTQDLAGADELPAAGQSLHGRSLAGPAYAIDDDTALPVIDGTVEVVSEGHWRMFRP